MFLLVEIDKKWTMGIDWYKYIKGVRLGWIAIHFFPKDFETFLNMANKKYHTRELEKLNEEAQKYANQQVDEHRRAMKEYGVPDVLQ